MFFIDWCPQSAVILLMNINHILMMTSILSRVKFIRGYQMSAQIKMHKTFGKIKAVQSFLGSDFSCQEIILAGYYSPVAV